MRRARDGDGEGGSPARGRHRVIIARPHPPLYVPRQYTEVPDSTTVASSWAAGRGCSPSAQLLVAGCGVSGCDRQVWPRLLEERRAGCKTASSHSYCSAGAREWGACKNQPPPRRQP